MPAVQPREASAQTIHACLNRVNVPIDQLHWLYIPESAEQLYSDVSLFFLAGQLISNGVVDASICPSDGLTQDGYANACGMATALPTVINVQNMLNEPILQAWKDVGVPPVLLKQLILTESQFWPSIYNGAFFQEFGFGMVTSMGMQNALEWNPNLYSKVCLASAGGNCVGYNISGQALSSLVSTCPTCEYGIDPISANRNVDILAEILLAHCYQTSQLVFNATGWYSNLAVDYATIWKLTLMNFNAGPNCVFDSVAATFKKTQGPMKWSDITPNVAGSICIRGLTYANQITAKFYDFPPK